VPDTTVGYGAATILGLKGGRTRRWVTTAEGNQGLSYAWYNVPLQDMGGRAYQAGEGERRAEDGLRQE